MRIVPDAHAHIADDNLVTLPAHSEMRASCEVCSGGLYRPLLGAAMRSKFAMLDQLLAISAASGYTVRHQEFGLQPVEHHHVAYDLAAAASCLARGLCAANIRAATAIRSSRHQPGLRVPGLRRNRCQQGWQA